MESITQKFDKIKSPELTEVETVLINNMYTILKRETKLMNDILSLTGEGKYKEVIECAQELKYINSYNSILSNLKDQLFEYGTIATLSKIIKEEKFNGMYNYSDQFTISKAVLKDFRYSTEFKLNDPKASLAKQLGAKLIA